MTSIAPTRRQMRYFDIARNSSLQSTYTRMSAGNENRLLRIGAAIVNGNYVVSEGRNKRKTHTVQYYFNKNTQYDALQPNIHAEIDALISSRYNDLTGCEIFVYREFMDGSLANCRPCKSCMSALKKAGIKHIYYTTESGYHYERIN